MEARFGADGNPVVCAVTMSLPERLVWLDLEMTGPDPDTDHILEIASVVTDRELQVVAEGPSLVVSQPASVLAAMDAFVTQMHTASGLLDRVRRADTNVKAAEAATVAFLREHVLEGKSPLCGSTIWKDRIFLKRYMPAVDALLHYRNVDVSTLKELVARWYPQLQPPPKKTTHRALDDIHESLAELRFYRREVFVSV